MKHVQQYTLEMGRNRLNVPSGASMIGVGWNSGEVVIWSLERADNPRSEVEYFVAWTGDALPDGALWHVGSGQAPLSGLAFHVFELLHFSSEEISF